MVESLPHKSSKIAWIEHHGFGSGSYTIEHYSDGSENKIDGTPTEEQKTRLLKYQGISKPNASRSSGSNQGS